MTRQPGSARRLGAAVPWVTMVIALLALGFLVDPPPSDGPPLDPASAAPAGTKALVETIRALGADVSVSSSAPVAQDDVVVVLQDDLKPEMRGAISDWVARGGTLVVADPDSELAPAKPAKESESDSIGPDLAPGCDLAAMDRIDGVSAPGATLFDVATDAVGCFPGGARSWMVVTTEGLGTVVGLGGPGALVNREITKADNALLVATLLAPTRSERVVIMQPPLPGGGRQGLGELIPDGIRWALMQFGVAFLVAAAWRARRLGPPVVESLPVVLPASDLVAAVGDLNQRARTHEHAAAVLRSDLRRTLSSRFGLPAEAPALVLAQAVAAQRHPPIPTDGSTASQGVPGPGTDGQGSINIPGLINIEEVAALLGDPEMSKPSGTGTLKRGRAQVAKSGGVRSEAALVELARGLENLRRRVNHG